MTTEPLDAQIFHGLRGYTSQTGLELKEDWLRLHINPEQLRDWVGFARTVTLNVDKALTERKLFGIPFVEDPEVAYGHPVLKSTWELVL